MGGVWNGYLVCTYNACACVCVYVWVQSVTYMYYLFSTLPCPFPCCRIALQVVFVDGVTRLECMKKSDEVKVGSMIILPVLIIRNFKISFCKNYFRMP